MRKICGHCGRAPVSRPRGLCWGCYYSPGVRELHPPRTQNTGEADAFGKRPLPPEPTLARPGSPAKVAVLCQRATQRWQLWHPEDRR